MRRLRWVVAGVLAAVAAARGEVSWDEHAVVDGVRWTARATGRWEFELGSDRGDGRALEGTVEGKLVLPATFKNGRVTGICGRAFAGMEGITEVEFPEGMKTIGKGAFAGCTGLTRVIVPDSVFAVEAGAFAGCIALKEVVLGAELWQLNERVFEGCVALERLEIRDGRRGIDIGDRAFADCTGLTRVDIGRRCEAVGAEAFAGCTGLKEVVIHGRMDRRAFAGCDCLERVEWDREGSFSLGIWGDKRTGWGPVYAHPGDAIDSFEGCTGVREVVINAVWPGEFGLAAIFPDAYGEIRHVTILDGSPYVPEGLFRGCAKLEEVVLPDSVKSIKADVFDGCERLKTVRWPAELREVDPNALRGASIEEGPVVAEEHEEGAAE